MDFIVNVAFATLPNFTIAGWDVTEYCVCGSYDLEGRGVR